MYIHIYIYIWPWKKGRSSWNLHQKWDDGLVVSFSWGFSVQRPGPTRRRRQAASEPPDHRSAPVRELDAGLCLVMSKWAREDEGFLRTNQDITLISNNIWIRKNQNLKQWILRAWLEGDMSPEGFQQWKVSSTSLPTLLWSTLPTTPHPQHHGVPHEGSVSLTTFSPLKIGATLIAPAQAQMI